MTGVGGEEQRPHAADAVDLVRHARPRVAAARSPSLERRAQRVEPGVRRVRRFSSCSVAMPAAIATGLPESVPAWNTGPAGMTFFMTSARPPYAPTGKPPPTILPSTVRSGVSP